MKSREQYSVVGGPQQEHTIPEEYPLKPAYTPEDVLSMPSDVVNDVFKAFSVREGARELIEALAGAERHDRITKEQKGVLFVLAMTFKAQNAVEEYWILREIISALSAPQEKGDVWLVSLERYALVPSIKTYLKDILEVVE